MTGGTIVADPMYRAIAEELRHDIESGELPPGSQLPAEFKLQDRFSASRNTVRDAIKSLVSLGLVVTRPGQGTFVAERIDPFVTTLSADAETGFGGGEGATYLSEVSRARHAVVWLAVLVPRPRHTRSLSLSGLSPHPPSGF